MLFFLGMALEGMSLEDNPVNAGLQGLNSATGTQ